MSVHGGEVWGFLRSAETHCRATKKSKYCRARAWQSSYIEMGISQYNVTFWSEMFDLVANSMIRGFAFVDGVSAEHEIEFGAPMTLMSRIQTVRSTMVAQLMRDTSGRLELSEEFLSLIHI